jgi:hypothetical protein
MLLKGKRTPFKLRVTIYDPEVVLLLLPAPYLLSRTDLMT